MALTLMLKIQTLITEKVAYTIKKGKTSTSITQKPNNLMEHIEVLTNGYSQIKVCNKLFVMD